MGGWAGGNDIERQRDRAPVVPRPVFGPTPQPTPTIQFTPGRALPPYAVEDRGVYLRFKQEEARRQVEARIAQARLFADRLMARANLPGNILRAEAAQRQPQDFRTLTQLPPSEAEMAQPSAATPPRRTTGLEVTGLPFAVRAAGTEIPYANQYAGLVREFGQRYIEPQGTLRDLGIPVPSSIQQQIGSRLPYVPTPAGAGGEVAASFVPTQVWMAALELVPGIGTVPDLVRAVRTGTPEAITAVSRAGQRLGQHEAVQRGLRAIGDETGILALGRKTEQISPHLRSSYLPEGEVRDFKTEGTLADFLVGNHRVSITASARKPEIWISTRRVDAPAIGYGNAPGGTVSNIRALGEFMEDLVRANPDKDIVARAGTKELADQYRRMAFEPFSDEAGVYKLRLNKDRLGRLMSRQRRTASERGAIPTGHGVPESVTKLLAIRRKGPRAGKKLTAEAAAAERLRLQTEAAERWELLPPVYQKFITSMADAVLTPAQRRTLIGAGRTRQTVRARQAIEEAGGTTLERAQAGLSALEGRIIPQVSPVGGKFDELEVGELFDGIERAFADRSILPQEHVIATDVINLLLYGKRPFFPKKPLQPMPHEIKLLGRIYGPEFAAAIPRTPAELSLLEKAIDVANLPRAMVTAIDVSAAGRQGIVLAARNPKEWGASWAPMIKSMAKEGNFEAEMNAILTDSYYEDAVTHGVDFTDIGGGASAEEAFVSGMASKIPGVRQSERGFNMFLNKLRMLTYRKYAQRLERTAQKWNWTPERLDEAKGQMGRFLNHASGRGDLKALNEYTPALNAIFFSPRFLASRFQTVWDLVRPGVDPAVRQMIFENLVSFVGMGSAMLATAVAAGTLAHERGLGPEVSVQLDPRSSDFGKVRIGNQRIEFWGGFQPIARFIAQLSTGQRKDLFTKENIDQYRGETALRFFRSKLSPAGSMLYDLTAGEGKTYEGENVFLTDPTKETAWREFRERLLPLTIQDAIEAYDAQGAPAAVTAGAVSALGGGVGTFEPSESQQKKIIETEQQKALAEAGYQTDEMHFAEVGKDVADALGIPEYAGEGSLKKMKAAYIDEYAPKMGLPEPEARDELAKQFEASEIVKEYRANLKEAETDFIRNNPQVAYDAWAAGELDLDEEQEKLLLSLQ